LINGTKKTLSVTLKHKTIALQGPLWSGTPNVNVELKSYLETKTSSIDRENLSKNLITANIDSVFGQSLNVSYLDADMFEFASNVETLESIPVMHVHFEGYKVKNLNDGLKYTYYKLGNYPNALKYSGSGISDTLSSGTIGVDGSLAKAVYSMLGTNQMGVVLSTICLTEKIGNRMQYRHGETVLWEDKNGSGTYLYTYLVFRRTSTANSAVLIPIHSIDL
jgi:hypothetical protein